MDAKLYEFLTLSGPTLNILNLSNTVVPAFGGAPPWGGMRGFKGEWCYGMTKNQFLKSNLPKALNSLPDFIISSISTHPNY
jgi:hypothetical protein